MRFPAAWTSVAAPLSPAPDDARDALRRELSDPLYQAAEPTVIDRIARAVGEFFANLFSAEPSGALAPAAAIVTTVVVVALLLAALLVWGPPRRAARRRAARRTVFDDGDERSAARLRADAADAAARGAWDDAVVLRFRALARGLDERVIVETAPGTTAQAFARTAARAFPAAGAELAAAAARFDDVRYLRRPATRDAYELVAMLDERLAREAAALPGAAG